MYVWTREVKSIEGNLITFVDGGTENITTRAQQYLVSAEPVEDDQLKPLTEVNVAADIVRIIEEHNVKLDYLFNINQQVERNLQSLNDKVYIKSLELEGNSDGEKMRSIRLSHFAKFLT